MSDPNHLEQFPALSGKLSAAKKETQYQRQKQEAEAKCLQAEEAAAAMLQTMTKEHEDGDSSRSAPPSNEEKPLSAPLEAPRAARAGPNRHFTPSARKSGPGTLEPASTFSRKRPSDGPVPPPKHPKGVLGFHNDLSIDSDDEDDGLDARIASSKPTMQLDFLPLGTSQSVIQSLLPETLVVDSVRVLQPSSNSLDRKSQSAIVTFATSTPIAAIDAAVSSLQNRYLGWGFYLSLSRGLSSAALGSSTATPGTSNTSSLPFGAKAASSTASSLRHAPPPSSYNPSAGPITRVSVVPPPSRSQLCLINKTLESLLTYGPEFEALLMTRPSVQRDEKWAWIWDSRSPGGVWYRWRLWQIMTGSSRSDGGKARIIFEGGAPWVVEGNLPFEFTTDFETLIDEQDYNSSEEDGSGDENGLPHRKHQSKNERYNTGGGPPESSSAYLADEDCEPNYLNPLQRAKLVHLLSRLPSSTAKLRVGDVARTTAFAITHAGAGAEETCELLALNVLQPLCLQPHLTMDSSEDDQDGYSKPDTNGNGDDEDQSQPTLVALRVVSDLLSASSACGIRHAWKYRQMLHSSLVKYGVFRHLGRMERDIATHSRIRAEKWRRSITQGVLALWEKWGVFLGGDLEQFVQDFDTGSKEGDGQAEKNAKIKLSEDKEKKESRWRAVDEAVTPPTLGSTEAMKLTEAMHEDDLDGQPMADEDLDGVPMTDEDLDGVPMTDADLDGVPMTDADLDGVPMTDENLDGVPMDDKSNEKDAKSLDGGKIAPVSTKISMKIGGRTNETRHRPRAVDMFADSDEEAA